MYGARVETSAAFLIYNRMPLIGPLQVTIDKLDQHIYYKYISI